MRLMPTLSQLQYVKENSDCSDFPKECDVYLWTSDTTTVGGKVYNVDMTLSNNSSLLSHRDSVGTANFAMCVEKD